MACYQELHMSNAGKHHMAICLRHVDLCVMVQLQFHGTLGHQMLPLLLTHSFNILHIMSFMPVMWENVHLSQNILFAADIFK